MRSCKYPNFNRIVSHEVFSNVLCFFTEKSSASDGGFAWENVPPALEAKRINYCTRGKSTACTFFRATADAEIWLASMSEIVFAVSTANRCSPAAKRNVAFTIAGDGFRGRESESLRDNTLTNRLGKSNLVITETIDKDDSGRFKDT